MDNFNFPTINRNATIGASLQKENIMKKLFILATLLTGPLLADFTSNLPKEEYFQPMSNVTISPYAQVQGAYGLNDSILGGGTAFRGPINQRHSWEADLSAGYGMQSGLTSIKTAVSDLYTLWGDNTEEHMYVRYGIGTIFTGKKHHGHWANWSYEGVRAVFPVSLGYQNGPLFVDGGADVFVTGFPKKAIPVLMPTLRMGLSF